MIYTYIYMCACVCVWDHYCICIYPHPSGTHTESVAENTAVNTVIYTYAAADTDIAPHAIVLYEIITCKNKPLFIVCNQLNIFLS